MPKRATPHRVAVVQQPPVTLHRQQTLERGVALIEEAAAKGARLISFPETWLPGYPEWLWRLRAGARDQITGKVHKRVVHKPLGPNGGGPQNKEAGGRQVKGTGAGGTPRT